MVKCQVETHIGHAVSENDFYRHKKIKKIDDNDMKLVKDLMEAEAEPKMLIMLTLDAQ